MEFQYFERALILAFMLTSQVLSSSSNDFPKSVVNSVINKTLNTPTNNEGPNINNTEKKQ